MSRTVVPLLVLVLPVLSAAACGKNPCRTYADRLCTDLGAGHAECKNARQAAEETTDPMREVCEEALGSYDDVLRALRRPPQAPVPPAAGTIAPAPRPPSAAASPPGP
jgi:hypothetical protein